MGLRKYSTEVKRNFPLRQAISIVPVNLSKSFIEADKIVVAFMRMVSIEEPRAENAPAALSRWKSLRQVQHRAPFSPASSGKLPFACFMPMHRVYSKKYDTLRPIIA